MKNYCGGHLLRCAVLATSPTYKVSLGRSVPCALQPTILATFFNSLLIVQLSGSDMPNKIVQIQASDTQIIAPCGINCSLCRSYIRARDPCPGCRGGDCNKSDSSLACGIKNCEEFATGEKQFCFSCDKFPCVKVLRLESRYKTRYRMSVIANLWRIKAIGVAQFITEEVSKWTCKECGSLLCMHKPQCVKCGYVWQTD